MYIVFGLILFLIFFIFYYYLAFKFNIMDVPNTRKTHKNPTPLIGGLCIFSTLYLVIYFFFELVSEVNIIVLGSFFILIIGFIDDFRTVKAYLRLSLQFFIVCIVVWFGIYIVDIGEYSFLPINNLGFIGIVLTLFSVLCLVNAINFIDGMDGLSISLIVIILINIYLNVQKQATIDEINFILLLIFLSLIFLLLNIGAFPKYKIFLGDAGSTSFGFIIAFLLIFFTIPEQRYFDPVLCIWIVTLPMFDLLNVILMRIFNNNKIYHPDRNHVHHILLKKGFTNMQVLFLLISLSITLNAIGHLIHYNFGSDTALVAFVLIYLLYSMSLKRL